MDKDLKLHINDNGRGFDLEKLKEKRDDFVGGFGLFSMRERVDLLGGELDIITEPGKGTQLDIVLPLMQEEEDTNEQQN